MEKLFAPIFAVIVALSLSACATRGPVDRTAADPVMNFIYQRAAEQMKAEARAKRLAATMEQTDAIAHSVVWSNLIDSDSACRVVPWDFIDIPDRHEFRDEIGERYALSYSREVASFIASRKPVGGGKVKASRKK